MVKSFCIILPCFNERGVIDQLLHDLEAKLAQSSFAFLIVLVDDGSTDDTVAIAQNFQFQSPKFQLKIIRVRHNSGHQEAIRHGLHFVHSLDTKAAGYIVMDSDGEDDPSAILPFIDCAGNSDITLVNRGSRREIFSFKVGYFFYRIIFQVITGRNISHGNFSMISDRVLSKIVHQPFIHYGSFLTKQKMDISYFTFDRAARIDNNPKMNFQSLVFHGLYSMIEYSEEILYSLMKLFVLFIAALFGIACYVLYSKYIAFTAISGWTSGVVGNLFISLLVIISTVILGLILLSIKKIMLQTSKNYDEV
jgi:glycosyltransferase involved in cell wall biosynthesis